MKNIYTIVVLICVVALSNLACGKDNGASLTQEEKYKIYWASTKTNDKAFQKDVIKKLGVGNGESPIPDHAFFVAFIDWTNTPEGTKAVQEIPFAPEEARDYVNKHLQKVTPEPTRVPNSPVPKPSPAVLVTLGEAESFIKSFYRDMEQNDLTKVLAYFDQTVDYYSYGRKDKAFIAEQIREYFTSFPIRSFPIGEVKLQPSPTSSKASVTFEIRYSLRNPGKGTISTGRSHVECDLAKRDESLEIVRFTGTSYPDAAAAGSPSP